MKILIWPNPILKKKSLPVDPADYWELKTLIDDMTAAMIAANGVGLSAVQVGVLKRVVVAMDGKAFGYFLNPEIVETHGEKTVMTEGCLSFPNVFEDVKRYKEVTVKTTLLDGTTTTQRYNGLVAQCLQHELEHLDGMLLSDKMPVKRARQVREYLTKVKKL